MNFRSQFSAYLCIASLLLGNAAGWLHIGCVNNGVASCTDIACAAGGIGGVFVEEKGHESCQHSHDDHQPNQRSKTPHHDSTDSTPVENPYPAEHDSDHCSVCQNFFASRTAANLTGQTTAEFLQNAESILRRPGRVLASSRPWRSISVRGPPRA